jgi:hypothetical protein
MINAVLFAALAVAPVSARTGGHAGHASAGVKHASSVHVAGGGSIGTAPGTGYHSSAGYGSAYGWGYNGWTRNGYKDGQWHGIPYSGNTSQPSVKRGNSPASYGSASEIEIVQQQVAHRRAQQAQQHSQTPAATPAASAKRP